MRLLNRFTPISPWLGLLLGLFVCSLPLMALAVEFKPPRRGIPGRREGGGTRDPLACTQGTPAQLIAMLPATNLGLTTSPYPRFFWFTPKTKAKFAEFTLYAANEQMQDTIPIYKTTFNITGMPGVTSLSLPSKAMIPPLAVGKDYHWSVALICNPNDRARDIKVNGWVQRLTPTASLMSQLATANPLDRVFLYANNGIWLDTLDTLAEMRCSSPKDPALAAQWAELMKSVQLNAIAEQSLLPQCKP